jgi:hypothetical protein
MMPPSCFEPPGSVLRRNLVIDMCEGQRSLTAIAGFRSPVVNLDGSNIRRTARCYIYPDMKVVTRVGGGMKREKRKEKRREEKRRGVQEMNNAVNSEFLVPDSN